MAKPDENHDKIFSDADEKLFDDVFELSRNGKNDEVIALSNQYLKTRQAKTDPFITHTVLAYKALAQFDIKQKTQARKTAMRACGLFPNCPWAQFVLALIFEDLARDKQAPDYFKEAMAAASILPGALPHPCVKARVVPNAPQRLSAIRMMQNSYWHSSTLKKDEKLLRVNC